MCGIVGFHLPDCHPDLALLRRKDATLIHWGPDGEGYFTDGPIGLATRYPPYSEQTPSLSPNEDRTILASVTAAPTNIWWEANG